MDVPSDSCRPHHSKRGILPIAWLYVITGFHMHLYLRYSIALAAASVFAGCTGFQGPQLIVDVGHTGSECSVRSVAMKCDDVPHYLRDTLKLPLDTYIAIRRPDAATTFEAMDAVMKTLDNAGYRSLIGLIELGPEAPAK